MYLDSVYNCGHETVHSNIMARRVSLTPIWACKKLSRVECSCRDGQTRLHCCSRGVEHRGRDVLTSGRPREGPGSQGFVSRDSCGKLQRKPLHSQVDEFRSIMGKRVEYDVGCCRGGGGRRGVERRRGRGACHQLHALRNDVVQTRLSLPQARPVILKHLAIGGRTALALFVAAQEMRRTSRFSQN